MKILIVDIYPKKNFRLIKDTNGAYGTGNDFGDGLFTRFLKYITKKNLFWPTIYSAYTLSVLRDKGYEVDYKTEISLNRVDRLESASPYYNEYKNVINSVNSKMKHGRDPKEVAELVSKIINEKNPKINYLVGGLLEKKITLKSKPCFFKYFIN